MGDGPGAVDGGFGWAPVSASDNHHSSSIALDTSGVIDPMQSPASHGLCREVYAMLDVAELP